MTFDVPSGEPERTTMKAALALARALRSTKPTPQHGPAAVHAWGNCVEAVGEVLAAIPADRRSPTIDWICAAGPDSESGCPQP